MKRLTYRSIVAALAAIFALAACSGGSRALPPISSAKGSGTASLVVKMTIPRKTSTSSARSPAYISSSTQSATYSVAGVTTEQDFTPSSPACAYQSVSPFALQCGTSLDVSPGVVSMVVKTFDSTGGTGTVLSTITVPVTITVGHANTFAATLDPVVASWQFQFSPGSPIAAGTPQGYAVALYALDADGNMLLGPEPFVDASGNPISASVSITNESAFALQNASTSAACPCTLAHGSDPQMQLTYDGTATMTPDIRIAMTTSAGTSQIATFALPIDPLPSFYDFATSVANWGLAITAGSGPYTATAVNSTPVGTVLAASSCAPETISTAPAGPYVDYTITSPAGTPASCEMVISAPWSSDSHADGLASFTNGFTPALVVPLDTTGNPTTDAGADPRPLSAWRGSPWGVLVQPAGSYTGAVTLTPIACIGQSVTWNQGATGISNVVGPAGMSVYQTVTPSSSTNGSVATVSVASTGDALCEYQSSPAPTALAGKAANVFVVSGGW